MNGKSISGISTTVNGRSLFRKLYRGKKIITSCPIPDRLYARSHSFTVAPTNLFHCRSCQYANMKTVDFIGLHESIPSAITQIVKAPSPIYLLEFSRSSKFKLEKHIRRRVRYLFIRSRTLLLMLSGPTMIFFNNTLHIVMISFMELDSIISIRKIFI